MIFKLKWEGINSLNQNIDGVFDENKELIKAGLLIKKKREEYSLTRSELSKITLISVAVLESIENAWTERLPEYAYLASMLTIIERELKLKPNSLDIFLENKKDNIKKESRGPITFGNINMFSNWQGSALYFIAMMVSILLINTQQKYLTIKNSQTIYPLDLNGSFGKAKDSVGKEENNIEVEDKLVN